MQGAGDSAEDTSNAVPHNAHRLGEERTNQNRKKLGVIESLTQDCKTPQRSLELCGLGNTALTWSGG